jgi:hypothetical protein
VTPSPRPAERTEPAGTEATSDDDWWDNPLFGGDDVYVWGLENPAGHVYFAKEDKAPMAARVKADRKKHEDDQDRTRARCVFPFPASASRCR